MDLEDFITQIHYPIISISTLNEIINEKLSENYGLFLNNEELTAFNELKGLIYASKAQINYITEIRDEHYNKVQKWYEKKRQLN